MPTGGQSRQEARPALRCRQAIGILGLSSGGSSGVDPPVPIPNTAVKRPSADDTGVATPWENRTLPGDCV